MADPHTILHAFAPAGKRAHTTAWVAVAAVLLAAAQTGCGTSNGGGITTDLFGSPTPGATAATATPTPEPAAEGAPSIASLLPGAGEPGATIEIAGVNLTGGPAGGPEPVVQFGATAGHVTSAAADKITVIVPSGLNEGTVGVIVITGRGPSQPVPFKVTKASAAAAGADPVAIERRLLDAAFRIDELVRQGAGAGILNEYQQHRESNQAPDQFIYGLAARANGQTELAGVAFDRARTLAPATPWGYAGAGLLAEEQDNHALAVREFNDAISRFPASYYANRYFARAAARTRDANEMAAHLRILAENYRGRFETARDAAGIQLMIGDFDAAELTLRAGIEAQKAQTTPDAARCEVLLWLQLAQMLMDRRDLNSALVIMEQLTSRTGVPKENLALIYRLICTIHLRLGADATAMEWAERALREGMMTPELLQMLFSASSNRALGLLQPEKPFAMTFELPPGHELAAVQAEWAAEMRIWAGHARRYAREVEKLLGGAQMPDQLADILLMFGGEPPVYARLLELYRGVLDGSLKATRRIVELVIRQARNDAKFRNDPWALNLVPLFAPILADPTMDETLKGEILDFFELASGDEQRAIVTEVVLRLVAVASLERESVALCKSALIAERFRVADSLPLLFDLTFRVRKSDTLTPDARKSFLQIIGPCFEKLADTAKFTFKQEDYASPESFWRTLRLAAKRNTWNVGLCGAIRRHGAAIEGFDPAAVAPSPEALGRVQQLSRWFAVLADMGGETGESLDAIRTRVASLTEAWSKP